MTWRIAILEKAEADLAWFRKNDRTCYIKCFDFVRELMQDPRAGTGKPERLKHFDREVWSRRVSHEHRMVYVIYADEEVAEVTSCRAHCSLELKFRLIAKVPPRGGCLLGASGLVN